VKFFSLQDASSPCGEQGESFSLRLVLWLRAKKNCHLLSGIIYKPQNPSTLERKHHFFFPKWTSPIWLSPKGGEGGFKHFFIPGAFFRLVAFALDLPFLTPLRLFLKDQKISIQAFWIDWSLIL
jgi:hypothetical protein